MNIYHVRNNMQYTNDRVNINEVFIHFSKAKLVVWLVKTRLRFTS